MRKVTNANPVSLFPFLAVLVSMMGALIFLLLVVTKQAQRQRDRQRLHTPIEANRPPLPDLVAFPPLPSLPNEPLPELVRRPLPDLPPLVDPRAGLDARRKALEDELGAVRAATTPAALDAEKDRLAAVSQLLEQLARTLDAIERGKELAVRSERALHDEVRRLEEEKARRERLALHVQNSYAVVPYTGPNGTKRRPILFECRKDRVVLCPEDVAIRPDQLRWPEDADNPLAAVVRALVAQLRSDGPDGVPYPLLIVRPEGIAAYYQARRALEPLGLPFGYELVGDDVVLRYPPPDPRLEAIARSARDEAVESQTRRHSGPPILSSWGPLGGDGPRGNSEAGADAQPGAGSSDALLPQVGASVRQISRLFQLGPAGRYRLPGSQTAQTEKDDEGLGAGPGGQAPQERSPGPSGTAARPDHDRGQDRGQDRANVGFAGDQRPGEQGPYASNAGDPSDPRSTQATTVPSRIAGGETESEGTGSMPEATDGRRGGNGASSQAGPLPSAPAVVHGGSGDTVLLSAPIVSDVPEPVPPNDSPPLTFEELLRIDPLQAAGAPRTQGFGGSAASGSGAAETMPGVGGQARHPLRRTVEVECRGDALVFYPHATAVPLTSDEDARVVAGDVYRHAYQQLENWPAPGPLHYWRPVVRFLVRPDGLDNYYRMWGQLVGGPLAFEKRLVDDGVPLALPRW